jgi:hypothetical protein
MGIFPLVRSGLATPDTTRPEEETIKTLLTAALQRDGVKFTWLDPWHLDLIMNGRLVSANLSEVVRSWRLAPEARRGEVVQRWVDATLAYPSWETRRAEIAESYAVARSHLLLRLQPAGVAKADHGIVRAYAPGIDVALFLDVDRPGNGLASAASPVTKAELARWQTAEFDVLAAARANTRRIIEPWHVGIQELDRGARVSLVVSEDSRGASPALFLPDLLPGPAPSGVLLAVPQYDSTMIHLIGDQQRTSEAVPWMVARAAQMFAVLPHPVSPELYWWRDGDVTLIRVDRSGRDWHISPDESFQEMYAGLPTTADENSKDEGALLA